MHNLFNQIVCSSTHTHTHTRTPPQKKDMWEGKTYIFWQYIMLTMMVSSWKTFCFTFALLECNNGSSLIEWLIMGTTSLHFLQIKVLFFFSCVLSHVLTILFLLLGEIKRFNIMTVTGGYWCSVNFLHLMFLDFTNYNVFYWHTLWDQFREGHCSFCYTVKNNKKTSSILKSLSI